MVWAGEAIETFMDMVSIEEDDLGWGNEAITDDGKTKFWDKKASDRRPQGPQVGGRAVLRGTSLKTAMRV